MVWWVAAFLITAQAAGSGLGDPNCVALSSGGQLPRGLPFSASIVGGLEFRLVPVLHVARESSGWAIVVGPHGKGAKDFLWVVSPPFQTAPQRMIGNGYGHSARESVDSDRNLRFVLTDDDYEAALRLIGTDRASAETLAALHRLGKGSLTLKVTAYGLAKEGNTPDGAVNGLDWIEFEGQACVPR